jgi:hypothetical protein
VHEPYLSSAIDVLTTWDWERPFERIAATYLSTARAVGRIPKAGKMRRITER